jgi:putative metallohydrolase (TIGR04338 family)
MSATCCQQFELYAAEVGVTSEPILPSSLQAYVDSLRESAYWRRNFPMVRRIEAYEAAPGARGSVGGWQADASCGVIEMHRAHLTELYVLHEVAHVLAAARYGSRSHDPWFARTYLELVYTYIGSEPYAALRAAFERGGVDHDTDSSTPAGIPL